MFWASQGLADPQTLGSEHTGRPPAGPPPHFAAGGRVPEGPGMINETWVGSWDGTDVERRKHLAPPACVVAQLLREALASSHTL